MKKKLQTTQLYKYIKQKKLKSKSHESLLANL